MKRFAVAGNPISYSLSPFIFNTLADERLINSHYTRLCGNSFDEIFELAKKNKIIALNVTSPYKEDAFNNADESDLSSTLTNVANTLIINDIISSYNSDVFGFDIIFKKYLFNSKECLLIFGGGATAKSTIFSASKNGFKQIDLAVRNSIDYDDSDLKKFNVNILDIKMPIDFNKYSALINTIPLNNYFDYKVLNTFDLTYIDTVYNKQIITTDYPKYISGLELLAYQAVPNIKRFLDLDVVEGTVLDALFGNKPEKINLLFVGFMGAGKSTIGKELSRISGRNYLDSDSIIEKRIGLRVDEIFSKFGEAFFRKIEEEVILSFPIDGNFILSTGGGSILNDRVLNYIKKHFYVIYLYSDKEILFDRIVKSNIVRPIAQTNDLRSLYYDREPYYFKSSDLIIDNSKSFDKTINLLLNEINNSF